MLLDPVFRIIFPPTQHTQTKLKEDQTHPVPLRVTRSYTPLLIVYYDTTV